MAPVGRLGYGRQYADVKNKEMMNPKALSEEVLTSPTKTIDEAWWGLPSFKESSYGPYRQLTTLQFS